MDANGRTYKGQVDSIAGSSGARTSLLPPENATGNYVKVVQRVPVKIVLDPGENSDHYLRLGMSVEPKVYGEMSAAPRPFQQTRPGSARRSIPGSSR